MSDSQQLKLLRNKVSVRKIDATGTKWQPPNEDRTKVNVDAHVIAGSS